MSLPDVLTNPAIQQMTQKRAELQSQYEQDLPAAQTEASSGATGGGRYPRTAIARSRRWRAESRDSIRNQYLTAQKQESELAGAVGHLKGSTLAEQQLRNPIQYPEARSHNQPRAV